MLNEIKKDAQARMAKSIEALRHDLTKLRTGRATTALVDHLKVNYYGSDMPLTQVASVTVSDARSLTITPWEKQMVSAVEKAILASDLGLTPNNDGKIIRLGIPALTEERRKQLTKVVHHRLEDARVAVRNIRRSVHDDLREFQKEKLISEDELERGETDMQKLTDRFVTKIDELGARKESEIMEI